MTYFMLLQVDLQNVVLLNLFQDHALGKISVYILFLQASFSFCLQGALFITVIVISFL